MDRWICPKCFCPHGEGTKTYRKGGCNTTLDYFDVREISALANGIAHDFTLAHAPPPRSHTKAKLKVPDELIIIAYWVITSLGVIGYEVFIKEPIKKKAEQLQGRLRTWLKRKLPHFKKRGVPTSRMKEFVESEDLRIEIIERTIERRYNITIRKDRKQDT